MENGARPFVNVRGFLDSGKAFGVYSDWQHKNLTAALSLIEPRLGGGETVSQVLRALPVLFQTYGQETAATTNTIRTYEVRARRALSDFIKWGIEPNWMTWKLENENQARWVIKRRAKLRANRGVEEIPEARATAVHLFKLAGGRTATLMVPPNMNAADIELLWRQIDAIKALLSAQAELEAPADA